MKVMKTQHQRPEFGHKQGENKKNLKMKKKHEHSRGRRGELKKVINFGDRLSPFCLHPSFPFPERLHCCYMYFQYIIL
jgi:hypothetical protein